MQGDGIEQVPVEEQVIAPLLAQWSENRPYEQKAAEGEFSASQLGGCARALDYRSRGVERTDPMTEAGFWATAVGSMTHDAIQEELAARPPSSVLDAGTEVRFRAVMQDSKGTEVVVASDVDLQLWFDGDIGEVGDIKTTAPFGFKKKATREGPDRGHLLQIAAGMEGLRQAGEQIDRGRLTLMSQAELKGSDRIDKSIDSTGEPGPGDGRANRSTEWTITAEAASELLAEEVERLAKIKRIQAKGGVVPRQVPGITPQGARVVDVGIGNQDGTWQLWLNDANGQAFMEDSGRCWKCRYCDWRSVCRDELMEGK